MRPSAELTNQIMSSRATTSRRERDSGSGSGYSRTSIVSGSMRAIVAGAVVRCPDAALRVLLDSVRQERGRASVTSLISPVDGSRRPSMWLCCSVKYSLPFGCKIRYVDRGRRDPASGRPDLAGRRHELADRPVAVPEIPDVALGVRDDAVRLRAGSSFHSRISPVVGFEPPDQADELAVPPDLAVRPLHRIARPLTQRRHLPFTEGDADGTGDELGRRPGWAGSSRRSTGSSWPRPRRQLDHPPDQVAPCRPACSRRPRRSC